MTLAQVGGRAVDVRLEPRVARELSRAVAVEIVMCAPAGEHRSRRRGSAWNETSSTVTLRRPAAMPARSLVRRLGRETSSTETGFSARRALERAEPSAPPGRKKMRRIRPALLAEGWRPPATSNQTVSSECAARRAWRFSGADTVAAAAATRPAAPPRPQNSRISRAVAAGPAQKSSSEHQDAPPIRRRHAADRHARRPAPTGERSRARRRRRATLLDLADPRRVEVDRPALRAELVVAGRRKVARHARTPCA